jgi:hypothetical protein
MPPETSALSTQSAPLTNTMATQPAPTVVSTQPAEQAIGQANQNIQNYNAQVANAPTQQPTTAQPNSSQNTTTQQSGTQPQTSPVNYGQFTDPKTGETSYWAQTGVDQNGNPTWASEPTDEQTALASGASSVQIPVMGAQGGVQSDYEPGANIDVNGNIIGTSVPAAVALGSSEDVASINARLSAINDQITQSGQDTITQLQQFQNGTIPMTPAQNSLIANMTTQMNNLIQLQTQANQSYIGSVVEAEARNGEEASSPMNSMAMIRQAVFTANTQLSSLAATQAIAIAQATDAAQKENFDEMLSANENYQDTLKQKQSVLETVASNIQSSIESARTFNFNVQNQNFQNNLASATLSMQQKQNLFSNYISTQNLSLAQKTQAEKFWDDQQNIAISKLQLGVSEGELGVQQEQAKIAEDTFQATFGTGALGTLANGNPSGGTSGVTTNSNGTTNPAPTNADGSTPAAGYKYNGATGQFTDGSGNPITGDALNTLKANLNASGVHTYSDGLAYLDYSGYTNPDLATNAQIQARAHGMQPLAPADASIVNQIETAKSDIANMQKYYAEANAPSSYITAPTTSLVSGLDTIFKNKGSVSLAISNYNSAHSDVISIMNSLANAKRANGEEIDIGTTALPTVQAFGLTTPQGSASANFSSINDSLNAVLTSVVPGFVPQPDPSSMNPTDVANALAGNSTQAVSSPAPQNNNDFLNAASTNPTQ